MFNRRRFFEAASLFVAVLSGCGTKAIHEPKATPAEAGKLTLYIEGMGERLELM